MDPRENINQLLEILFLKKEEPWSSIYYLSTLLVTASWWNNSVDAICKNIFFCLTIGIEPGCNIVNLVNSIYVTSQ